MVGAVCARQCAGAGDFRRTGADTPQAAAGRRDPQPAGGTAILARRPRPGSEHLATVDGRAQHPSTRRQPAGAVHVGLHGIAPVGSQRSGLHQQLPRPWRKAGLLVDGRRLVPLSRLARDRHVGAGSLAVSAWNSRCVGPCAHAGDEDDSLVRARAGARRKLAVPEASRLAPRPGRRPAAEPGQPRSAAPG